MQHSPAALPIAILSATAFLVACSSGGGSSPTQDPPPDDPQAVGSLPSSLSVATVHATGVQDRPELTFEPDGSYYLRCRSESSQGVLNTFVCAFDSSGAMRWQKEYQGEFRVRRAPNGRLWLASERMQGVWFPVAALVDATNGQVIWQVQISSIGSRWIDVPELEPSVLLTELRFGPDEDAGLHFGALDASGTVRWAQTSWNFIGGNGVGATTNDQGLLGAAGSGAIRCDANGVPAWGGLFTSSPEFRHIWECANGGALLVGTGPEFVALDGHGQLSQHLKLKVAADFTVSMTELYGDAQSGFYLGVLPIIGTPDPCVVRLDPNGSVVWRRVIGTPAAESLTKILPTANGGCVVVGKTAQFNSGSNKDDAWLICLDAAGDVAWERVLDLGDSDTLDFAEITDDGHVVVAGTSFIQFDSAAWLAVLKHDGSVVRRLAFSAPAVSSRTTALARLPNGSIVYTAASKADFAFASKLIVVKLDEHGAVSSAVTLADCASVAASELGNTTAIALSPNGSIVIASSMTDSNFTDLLDTAVVTIDGASGRGCGDTCKAELTLMTVHDGSAVSTDTTLDITGQSTLTWTPSLNVFTPNIPLGASQYQTYAGAASIQQACGN